MPTGLPLIAVTRADDYRVFEYRSLFTINIFPRLMPIFTGLMPLMLGFDFTSITEYASFDRFRQPLPPRCFVTIECFARPSLYFSLSLFAVDNIDCI